MRDSQEQPVVTHQNSSNCMPKNVQLTSPDQLRLLVPDFATQINIVLSVVTESLLHLNIINVQMSMQQFMHIVEEHFKVFQGLERHISEIILKWKDEQQKTEIGLKLSTYRALSLDELQSWCEELLWLLLTLYWQLEESEQRLEQGVLLIGNNTLFTAALTQLKHFVQHQKEKAHKLIEDFLSQSIIVEKQPPLIYDITGKSSHIDIVVSILGGNRLILHNGTLEMSTNILCEIQPECLSEIDESGEKICEVQNGRAFMNEMEMTKDNEKRVTFNFRNMKIKVFREGNKTKKGKIPDKKTNKEDKFCLRFECSVKIGYLNFLISTISRPFVVRKPSNPEWIADATITWDHAFGKWNRVPFKVPNEAPWDQVGQILNEKFGIVTGGMGLTSDNLSSLAQKIFRNSSPHPKVATWSKLCVDKFKCVDPKNREFTFWQWFHETLKLTANQGSCLKDLWNDGLIVGFIDRKDAETLLSHCKPGTFLLRFSDTYLGAITIAVNFQPGSILHSELFRCEDLQTKSIVEYIKGKKCLKYLYKPGHIPNIVPKDEAFGKFYNGQNGKALLSPYSTFGISNAEEGNSRVRLNFK